MARLRNLAARLRRSLSRAPAILMYHRVAELAHDPWDLAVTPERFEAQMAVLKRRRTPLPLAEFVDRLGKGALPSDAVAVTFDDGYVDNLLAARPALVRHQIPATVFLATGRIGQPEGFWWDELAAMILSRQAGLDAEVEIGGETVKVVLSDGAPSGEPDWRGWDEPTNDRQAAYVQLWRRLQALDDAPRQDCMARLRRLLGNPAPSDADRAMTPGEVRELVAGGLVTIGGHTVTHPKLSGMSVAAQQQEIAEGKAACEALVGADISSFAYPYGEYDEATKQQVRQSGFSLACTTRSMAVRGRWDVFELPRVQAPNLDAADFERELAAA